MPHQDTNDFEASGHFAKPAFRRYERELTYTAREYRDLLLSYSGHRALAPDAREGCWPASASSSTRGSVGASPRDT